MLEPNARLGGCELLLRFSAALASALPQEGEALDGFRLARKREIAISGRDDARRRRSSSGGKEAMGLNDSQSRTADLGGAGCSGPRRPRNRKSEQ